MIFNPEELAIIIALPHESQNLFEKANIEVNYCGIGKINATQKITEILLSECRSKSSPKSRSQDSSKKIKHVLNLGTAGSHKIEPGTLVELSSVIQRDLEFTPFDEISGKIEIPTFIKDLHKVICGTGDTVERNPQSHYDIMDMEAYAIAKICKRYGVGFTSIKYITDKSDTQTLKDWKAALPKASQALFDIYKKIII